MVRVFAGDRQFYTEVFKFPQWNSAISMCWLCRASSTLPNLPFTDFSRDAGWRSTRWSHEEYISDRTARGLFTPVLLSCVIGLRLECIMIDVLHTVDLGLASHIIGNVIWLFAVVRGVFGGINQADKIKNAFEHIQAWYKRTKCTSKIRGSNGNALKTIQQPCFCYGQT